MTSVCSNVAIIAIVVGIKLQITFICLSCEEDSEGILDIISAFVAPALAVSRTLTTILWLLLDLVIAIIVHDDLYMYQKD